MVYLETANEILQCKEKATMWQLTEAGVLRVVPGSWLHGSRGPHSGYSI